jgi:ABC-type sugar transport system substrate-binding protein
MRPRVVVALITDQNDYQVFQAADARRVAEKEGLQVEVQFGDNNAIQQIAQLFAWINAPPERRPAALVVEPVAEPGIKRVAQNALQAGIGWVLLNRHADFVEQLRGQYPAAAVSAVLTDQIQVGRLQGEQYTRLLPGGGRVLYVQGPAQTTVAQSRAEGMLSVIRGSKIAVTSIDGNWTAESAESAFQAWERLSKGSGPRVDLVGAQNDAMALGVRRLTRDHPDPAVRLKWSTTLFTGVDGLPEGGQRMVDRAQLAATVIAPSNTGPALEMIARFLRQGERPPAQVVQPPVSYPPLPQIRPAVAP